MQKYFEVGQIVNTFGVMGLVKVKALGRKVWSPKVGMTWNWILNADSTEINV